MEPKVADATPFKLELVDDVPSSVSTEPTPRVEPLAVVPLATLVATPTAPPVATVDRFVARAMRERDGGVVDNALWTRALALADGDEAATVQPYLRARAAMLKLAESRAHAAVAGRPHVAPPAAANEARVDPPRPAKARPRPLVLALATVGVAVLAVLAWMAMAPDRNDTAVPAATTARTVAKAAAPAPVAKAEPDVDPGIELAARVAALRSAGNWNVLVLHASEWTRRKPDEPLAWVELAGGYVKLKQTDEAFEAAKRAVALDPKNATGQRLLAGLYLALDRPADALAASEQAVALDERNADALALLGTIHAKLARLPDARNAFERALALDPVHVTASCGMLDVSRAQGRARDAEVLAKALQAASVACPAAAVAAAVAPPHGVAQRSVAPAARR